MPYLGETPKSSAGELRLLLDSKAAAVHGHAIADIANLQNTLSGKSDTGHGHDIANVSGLQAALDTKVNADYVSNAVSAVSIADASTTVAGKVMLASVADLTSTDKAVTPAAVASGLSGKANTNHSHDISNVSGLQAVLDSKASTTDISNALSGYTPSTASMLSANAGAASGSVGSYSLFTRSMPVGYVSLDSIYFQPLNVNDTISGVQLGNSVNGTWKVMSETIVFITQHYYNGTYYMAHDLRLYLRIA